MSAKKLEHRARKARENGRVGLSDWPHRVQPESSNKVTKKRPVEINADLLAEVPPNNTDRLRIAFGCGNGT